MKNVLMSVTLASAVALLSQCASAENVTYRLEGLDLSWMTKGQQVTADKRNAIHHWRRHSCRESLSHRVERQGR